MKRLAGILPALVVLAAYAALLGWLKSVYFLKPFGLSPGLFESRWADPLFESWYVLQNLAYFTGIVWLAVLTRRMSLALIATAYGLIPLTTHYAFLAYDRAAVRFWVDHQHTWLKAVPLLLLVGLLLSGLRGRLPSLRWPHGRGGAILLALVVGSWGLSSAKHLGSHDAERLLRRPEELLPRVSLAWKNPPPEIWHPEHDWRLLRADARTVVVVRLTGNTAWERSTPEVRILLRLDLDYVDVAPRTAVQPGGQYF